MGKLWVYLRWYHLCFTYDHLQHLYNTFINGELIYELTYDVDGQIYGNNVSVGQSGRQQESFSGALSQVNMWDSVLSMEMIADMAACEYDPQGNYISWEGGWDLHNITEYQASLEYFCEQITDIVYFGFPKLSKPQAFYICEALGSHLPLPTTINEVNFWYNLSYRVWPDQLDLFMCSGSFWTPITDVMHDGIWVIHYDNTIASSVAWKVGEPNGLFYENCAIIEQSGIADTDCATNERCAICEFRELQIFSFLGTCELEDRNVHYSAFQEDLGDLYFKGYGEYHIRKVDDDWLWINVVTNKTLARLDPDAPFGMPMGRRVWYLETTVCDQREGSRTLVLTPCGANSYTCDDATCIAHENRCDHKYDCLDHSDEVGCELIRFPEDYNKDLPPEMSDKEGSANLPLTLNISIEFTNIYTMQMVMQVSYKIQMIWFDNRLVYCNLKANHRLNKVNYTNMMSLWLPTVGFINTEGHQRTTVDEESSLYVRRLQPARLRDNSFSREMDLFSGEENSLFFSRKYSTPFICDFNLVLYPFDVQYCDMRLQIISGTKDYITFDKVASFAAYYGSAWLLEYQIRQPKIIFDNNNEFSEMKVRIPLQRLSGYAVLNIYIPSTILLVICYITLFLRPHFLEARVMTTLTSLLVLATLFTQASATLPKTSYFKMVDVWILFCIVMSFIIIIFHTIIDKLVDDTASALPPLTKVSPAAAAAAAAAAAVDGRPPNTTSRSLRNFNTARGFILFSRSSLVAIFAVFNFIYWSYIFG
nr:uncharacterized protein LOC128685552 [Cherax quadricarinatus]